MSEQEEKPKVDTKVALSRFKEEIELQAKTEADSILKEAKEEANKILEAGKKEADSYKTEALSKAKSEAELIKVREVSRIRQGAKMDYLGTREKVFEEILVEARSKLQAYTKSKDYPKFLSKLLKESCVSIGGGELSIQLKAEDKSLLSQELLDKISKEVSKELGVQTKLNLSKNELNALGGIKVIRKDNKLFVDNTFSAIMTRKDDEIRLALAEIIEE